MQQQHIISDSFDTLIKLTLLHDCEIWGIKIMKNIEQLHIKLIKIIPGVKRSINAYLV